MNDPLPLLRPDGPAFEGEGLHRLSLTARHSRAALAAVDHALAASGAALRRLTLRELSGLVEADLQVAEISAPSARRLADRLSARPGVSRVRVEHEGPWAAPR